MEASPEQRIRNLELVKAKLVDQSVQLQQKIKDLEQGSNSSHGDRGRQPSR